jgi:hypothetical protein
MFPSQLQVEGIKCVGVQALGALTPTNYAALLNNIELLLVS